MNELDRLLEVDDIGQELRTIASNLWFAAERAGCEMSAHRTSKGLRYVNAKVGRRLICRFDLKPVAGHVCVCIPGASERTLLTAGEVHRCKDAPSWVHVRTAQDAKRLEPEIRAGLERISRRPKPRS